MSELLRRATKVMLIRHAEKPGHPDGHHIYGVTLRGKFDKESLSVRGWQRAGALACLLAPVNDFFQDPALARPQFLYASKPKKHNGSHRPLETITPLAEKLAIEINSDFPKLAAEDMLEDALKCDGIVLICWQQENIPKIANYILRNTTTAPQVWPEARFDMTWVFERDPLSGEYSFGQVPQRLLTGDSSIPIK